MKQPQTLGIQRRALLALAAGLGLAARAMAQAAWKPPGTVKIVVPFPPGGSADAAARLYAEGLTRELQQTVIVDNRPGAGTTIAAAYVAGSAPDGTTLFLTGPVSQVTSGLLYPNLRYDPIRSFAPVSTLTSAPFLITVPAASPYKSLAELMAAAKKEPGKITFGSSGTGASAHLVGEILAETLGLKLLHVPYRGAGPAMTALLGGQIDLAVSDASAIPMVRAGRVRALAVTTARRSALAPEVSTVHEAVGIDFDEPAAIALLAPTGLSPAAREGLSQAVGRVAAQPEFAKKLATQGMEPFTGSPAQLAALMQAIQQRYGAVIRRLEIHLE